jgi:hypothetical protein
LSSHLRLVLPSGIFPSGLPTKILYEILHTYYMPRPSYPPWLGHPNIWCSVQIMKLIFM